MYNVQLSDDWFVEINEGDLYVYKTSPTTIEIKEVTSDFLPQIDANTVEIWALATKRHFVFRRCGESYWWEERNDN